MCQFSSKYLPGVFENNCVSMQACCILFLKKAFLVENPGIHGGPGISVLFVSYDDKNEKRKITVIVDLEIVNEQFPFSTNLIQIMVGV